jgi:AcrR family transcriptional regulator
MTGKSMKPSLTTKKEVVAAFRTREILAAAKGLLAQQGIDALTMDEIAQAAGVAKGTLYLYFQSKDELIQALLSQVAAAIIRDLEAILARPDTPQDKLRQVVILLLDYAEQESTLFPLYLRELVRSKSGKGTPFTTFQELEESIQALISRIFADGMAQRHFIPADPRFLTFLLKGILRAVGYYGMTQDKPNLNQEALPVVLTLLFSGIVLPPAADQEESVI